MTSICWCQWQLVCASRHNALRRPRQHVQSTRGLPGNRGAVRISDAHVNEHVDIVLARLRPEERVESNCLYHEDPACSRKFFRCVARTVTLETTRMPVFPVESSVCTALKFALSATWLLPGFAILGPSDPVSHSSFRKYVCSNFSCQALHSR